MTAKENQRNRKELEHLEPLFRRASELDVKARQVFLASLPKDERDEIESLIAFDRPDDRIPRNGPLPNLPNVKDLLRTLLR